MGGAPWDGGAGAKRDGADAVRGTGGAGTARGAAGMGCGGGDQAKPPRGGSANGSVGIAGRCAAPCQDVGPTQAGIVGGGAA